MSLRVLVDGNESPPLRRRMLRITNDPIRQLLLLPENSHIVAIETDTAKEELEIIIDCDDFQPNLPGAEIPWVYPQYEKRANWSTHFVSWGER